MSSEVTAEATTDPTPETSAVDEKKLKKMEQLQAARQAKAQKKLEKAEEDKRVRDSLLRLEQENQDLKRKRDEVKATPAPEPVDDDDDEEEAPRHAKRARPVKVTRDVDKEDDLIEPAPGRSFLQQAAVTAVVGGLGLASWYAQNRLFQPTTTPVAPVPHPVRPPVPKVPKVPAIPPPPSRDSPMPKKTTTRPLFSAPRSKKPVGKSGFSL